MSVPDHPNVYAIGVGAKRLTFLSQQQRALNLVWKLRDTGRLVDEAAVAVVGGGLAGVTAAAAANLLGAKVTLFERQAEILHLQRGTQLRFIQPNIYDWPDAGSEDPLTKLPLFNWGAGVAASVVETILGQWNRIAGDVEQRLNYEVRELVPQPDGKVALVAEGPVTVRTTGSSAAGGRITGGTGVFRGRFDLVIVAVGFGLERTLTAVPFRSYWENDNLARTVISGPVPRRFLVSGCGDGGLIDAIRLRIRDFDHARFVRELLSYQGVNSLKSRLRTIDREASRLKLQESGAQKVRTTAEDEAEARRAYAYRQSTFLQEQYEEAFAKLERLGEDLANQLRSDTIVYLNGQTPTPLTLDSSILNRVAVFLLIKHGGLRYRVGEVSAIPAAAVEHVRVSFRRDGYPTEELEVHEVVVRHGPLRAIDRIFSKSVRDKFVKIDPVHDKTRIPMYPERFWSSDTLDELTRQIATDYAAASFPRALQSFGVRRSGQSLTLEIGRSGVKYVVKGDAQPTSLTEKFETIPVMYQSVPVAATRRRRRVEKVVGPQTVRRLFCGVGIATARYWKRSGGLSPVMGSGTLGCFVRLADGRTALLTSASIMSRDRPGEPLVAPGVGERSIGTVTFLHLPTPSPQGANLSAKTALLNEFEAMLAVLAKGVSPVPGFDSRFRVHKLAREDEPARGERVFKIGLGTGLTRGQISQIRVTMEISGWSGPSWFQNLFAVESDSATPFSGGGDAGAVIVRERDGAVLGLLIGGSDRSTVAEPIIPVLKHFGCALLLP